MGDPACSDPRLFVLRFVPPSRSALEDEISGEGQGFFSGLLNTQAYDTKNASA